MISFEAQIIDPIGLHARPAAGISKLALAFTKEFDVKISITSNGKTVNAASTMSIMTLGAKSGQTFKLEVEGQNEEEIFNTIKDYMIKEKLIA
ncbi:putative Phosphocarrier protein HPr [Mesomycoplasma conjunctivae]|uniref:Phosphocarrier protein HPr n=1 Tax=Mesomycoplasma conjunctivae (strain ATCC 25834 / NCTC 10147 / HRC/581) TaxID=572263 RepID=C5J5Z4_MESCH|nr:HPr family phosphocarrier protein [Mesomycoplasma conjunctivae]CAT04886.1 PUTATIVE Phosphocarrier protein HPr [Mesomycoplasma conjunctivae]VEU65982.1 putative Phosphocarrier protein HPr [Mesomycoplasma conjunctivae]